MSASAAAFSELLPLDHRTPLPARAPVVASRPWLCTALWDVIFLLSGLWLSLVVAVLSCIGLGSEVMSSSFWRYTTIVFWAAHNLSPVTAAWAIPRMRQQVLLKDSKKYILIPVGVVVGSLTLGLFANYSVAPGEREGLLATSLPEIVLFYLFFCWNSYHFACQHFGILQIYSHRTPPHNRTRTRSRDRLFCLATTCCLLPLAWYTQSQRWGVLLDYLPRVAAHGKIAQVVVLLCVLLTLRVCSIEFRESFRYSPRFFYLFSIGLQPVLAVFWSPLFSMASFTVCHWVAAVGLSSHIMACRTVGEDVPSGTTPRTRFIVHMMLLILVSFPLFYLFMDPTVARWLAFQVSAGDPVARKTAEACFSKLLHFGYFGFGFVHFLYDRYLYEFRNQDVRTIVGSRLYGGS